MHRSRGGSYGPDLACRPHHCRVVFIPACLLSDSTLAQAGFLCERLTRLIRARHGCLVRGLSGRQPCANRSLGIGSVGRLSWSSHRSPTKPWSTEKRQSTADWPHLLPWCCLGRCEHKRRLSPTILSSSS